MLAQAIEQAIGQAQQIINDKNLPSEAASLRQHAQEFIDKAIPELKRINAQIIAFARAADMTVETIIKGVKEGREPDAFSEAFHSLVEHIGFVREVIDQGTLLTTQYRDIFAEDDGQLMQAEIECKGKIKVAQNTVKRKRQELAAIESRIKFINRLAIINPLVKVVSELQSLIANKKTTEKMRADAARSLNSGQAKLKHILTTKAQLEALEGAGSELVHSVQNIANSIYLLEGKLHNEAEFLKAAQTEALLFLEVMRASLKQLVEDTGELPEPKAVA